VRPDRVAALEAYMREQLQRLSPKNDLAKAINYRLTRWASFTRFLDDGSNAAERALRCVAVGRRNWTFAGPTAEAGAPQPCTASSSRHYAARGIMQSVFSSASRRTVAWQGQLAFGPRR
jgi:hypothetical protein